MNYILPFSEISMRSLPDVGGKNASLGEMYNNLRAKGINVPDGFALTSAAYWKFLQDNDILPQLESILGELDWEGFGNLKQVGEQARSLVLSGAFPAEVVRDLETAWHVLRGKDKTITTAVRSSATAEDLPAASFAGQLESYLNISSLDQLLATVQRCYASLYTDRAIKYRADHGFSATGVAISVGVQRMVRSDQSCSGVAFTLDPDSGFRKVIVINGAWGLGENIVQGRVTPDEYVVFKETLGKAEQAIISKQVGSKELTMVYAEEGAAEPVVNVSTPPEKREMMVLSDEEATSLATWCRTIEEHYQRPMDIEWAKDGINQEIYIVQARPETVHSLRPPAREITGYKVAGKGKVLTRGIALGEKIASGKARILATPADSHLLEPGDVLVTDITNPDWDPIMKKAAAIVTNKGGRTSHAAIVAREIGVVAIVGAGDATAVIQDGMEVTVSCAEGKTGVVYEGKVPWTEHRVDLTALEMPQTDPMLILGDPDRAFQLSFYPNRGIGLLRLEFIISNSVCIHPLALTRFGSLQDQEAKRQIEQLTRNYPSKEAFFVDKLSQAVATIAAAFHPHDVIVRMSDFKSNEYANLIGGRQFEPDEENPMLGFRGASRYYSPLYKDGFELECRAMKKVRNEMGLTNVKLMIPFCRTVEEGRKVIETLAEFGLVQGENGLEVYMMVEIPSNALLADQFAEIFDGFSIGTNDLTQLVLGLDRDSTVISPLFDEQNEAVKMMIERAIRAAHEKGIRIGLCGQAPSDMPEFAQFLVQCGIDSISFNPDALVKGIQNISIAESQKSKHLLQQDHGKSI